MTSLRKFLLALFAMTLAAFALPAGAATKQISLSVTSPTPPFTAATTTVTLVLSNDGNSNGNSYEIDWIETANFHVVSGSVGGTAGSPVNPGVWASPGKPYQGLVWNKAAPAKTKVTVTLTVQVTPGCPASAASFAAAMWTGSPGPLSTSFPMPSGPISAAIGLGAGTCGSLSISAPASALLNTAFSVTVNEVGGPGGADVMLGSACTYSGGETLSPGAGNHAVTFSSFTLGQTGHCTITATDPSGGYTSDSKDVYVGTLDCNVATNPVFPPAPGSAGYFANLPTGVSDVSQSGFAAGYRMKNDKGDSCQLVNFIFTNNITGTGNTTDANGNTIPPNSAGLVWDLAFQPNAVFVYVLTFLPEYADPATGLPIKKTKFCILGAGPTDCANTDNQANLQACLTTAFSFTAIPGGDPACIQQETWATVDPSECTALGLINPNGTNPPPACVKATDRVLDARDPPIIR